MATISWFNGDDDDASPHSGPLGSPNTISMKSPTTLPAARSLLLSRTRHTPDIAGMLISGYGFNLKALDFAQMPHVMGVYDRSRRTLLLDWRILIPQPPQGEERLRTDVWRRVFDSSRLARFLAAWCLVLFATEDSDRMRPLCFNPKVTVLLSDEKKRLAKVSGLVGLLAPRDELNRQLQILGMPFHVGDAWREQVPAEVTRQVIDVLAEYNNCPAVIVETALDGCCLSWQIFTNRLLETLPLLRMRRYDAMRWFSLNNHFNALVEVFLDL